MDNFMSSEEAARYWKEQANTCKTELEALRKEYAEYQEDSKTLEAELDMELQQHEAKSRDLNACVIKLKTENEGLKSRLEVQTQTELRQHTDIMQELGTARKQVDELKRYVRQLEQKNDDLEKGYRAAQASIDDFEIKLNRVIERNVILEGELDDKEQLKVLAQRFRDESRDLRSELSVLHSKAHTPPQDSNRIETNGQLPPTRRVRANPVSLVNDLLRKVGVIEHKLAAAACKS